MTKFSLRPAQLVYANPWLHQLLFNTLTFNWDRFKQQLSRGRYPSKFGGMWTDRDDFEARLEQKIKDRSINEEESDWLRDWNDAGLVVMERAVPHDVIDRYMKKISEMMDAVPSPLLMTSFDLAQPAPFTHENLKKYGSARIVDDFFHAKDSRDLLFHPAITRFLELAFEREPLLTQSLRFDYGSEQPIHQDTAFVRMNSPMKFAGVWLALEDIKPGSGELIYLKGSHRWEGFLFSDRFKHYDPARDGEDQLAAWHQWILDEAERRGVKPEKFVAKKGDILFWHAGLAHGGSPITSPGSTRLSLVGHYCAQGVRPLYHYNKPRQRRIYRHGDYRYTTSYYR